MAPRNSSPFFWSRFDDERLLDLRLRELRLGEFPPYLAAAINELRQELAGKGLRLHLHFWWAREWFSPDGVPGIAVPFYLAHPRLTRLERARVHCAEGASPESLRKILRHEAGHAVMNAYRLREHPEVRERFGPSERPYPSSYEPRAYSRRFVRHLGAGYAQSHPDEDFAETFAIWLAGGWRERYAGWPALAKLVAMDRWMRELAGRRPAERNRRRVEPLEREAITLRQHYAERRRQLRLGADPAIDPVLRGVFPAGGKMTAVRFLRKIKKDVARRAALEAGRPRYEAERVVERLIRRSRELGLAVPRQSTRGLEQRLSLSTRRLLESGRHPIFM